MYSRQYRKISSGIIDQETNKKFIEQYGKSISIMSKPDSISFHFAIMEVETWWLSMYTLFEKINPILTVDYIYEKIGINLKEEDIEECVFHPFIKLKQLMESIDKTYDKKYGEVEAITSYITVNDIESGISDNRCASLYAFYSELRSFII
ncbi:Uncharacterised protein [Candidatus Venteria ishoeyi]|uniref:Uncharacterized protein n=2 Tax=Candidatus Venteria ishoeyi TaxID=1899563 RepID=A0A1H6F8I1_9GAMM|nr:Uncharacterised protein [Candidatus Venteria ishoeyi]